MKCPARLSLGENGKYILTKPHSHKDLREEIEVIINKPAPIEIKVNKIPGKRNRDILISEDHFIFHMCNWRYVIYFSSLFILCLFCYSIFSNFVIKTLVEISALDSSVRCIALWNAQLAYVLKTENTSWQNHIHTKISTKKLNPWKKSLTLFIHLNFTKQGYEIWTWKFLKFVPQNGYLKNF